MAADYCSDCIYRNDCGSRSKKTMKCSRKEKGDLPPKSKKNEAAEKIK